MANRNGLPGVAFWALACLWAVCLARPLQAADAPAGGEAALTENVTQGALRVTQKDGSVVECPLKHTDVQADISGFLARVKVTQTFYNPLDEKIEAVYVFPLPHEAAVDDMTMVIGQRRIVGLIKRRAEARQIYEEALRAGQTAALLEQERPNIFTQSVGNIAPKQEVRIEISYVDVLKYDLGTYEFHFPMVVGPRYNPAGFSGGIGAVPAGQTGASGQKVEVQYLKPGERNGHDISLAVSLNAGVPVRDMKVIVHQAEVRPDGDRKAAVKLAAADSIPNKDFVLRYSVVGEKPEMAVLCHRTGSTGYFMLMVQPKEDEKLRQQPPREMVFLIDISGSMRGQPNAKCREAMRKALELCREQDTVQIVTFAGMANKLFEKARPCTKENIATALRFSDVEGGSGGTEMLKGVQMAINDPLDAERVRIVVMLTDGYIGNEAQIIEEVGKRCGDRIRFWVLGIGNSINRFLVDGVAKQGGGMGKVVLLNEDPTGTVQEMMFRIQRAQLAKVRINWGEVTVWETYPARIPELWAGRPVILFGMYDDPKKTRITVSGEVEGTPASWPLEVEFPAECKDNGVLAKVWARYKIEDLMQQTYYQGSPAVEEAVTGIALDYRLMSQYTSFVAVDESEVAKTGDVARPPRRMLVAVPLPEGTSYEGVFGEEAKSGGFDRLARKFKESPADPAGVGGAFGVRSGGGRKLSITRYGGAAAPRSPAPAASRTEAAARPALANAPMAQAPSPMFGPIDLTPSGPGGAEAFKKLRAADAAFAYHGGAPYQAQQVLQQQIQARRARLPELAKEAEALKAEGRLEAARAKFAAVQLLDSIGESIGWGLTLGGKPLAEVEQLSAKLVEQYSKDEPRLNKKLDLVLRDKALPEALEAVAKQSGLPIELIPGSVEDAAALLGRKDVRVTYLDLRNATAAQALDWILYPARLDWWMSKGSVVAGSARRSGLETAWVYDVSSMALPLAKDVEKEQDYQKRMELVKKSLDEFAAGVRKALSLKDDATEWYAPGQILVIGTGEVHAKAADLFRNLAQPLPAAATPLDDLQRVTCARAAANREETAKRDGARELGRVYDTMERFSWQLLAEAAVGRLNMEALTELDVAWRSGEAAELLKGPGSMAALRSAWAICESSGALPKEAELAALAQSATEKAAAAADEALAALQKDPTDVSAFGRVTYAALAKARQTDFRGKALAALRPAQADEKSGLAPLRLLAGSLLAAASEADRKGLIELVDHGPAYVSGDDLVVLTALACRRAGGDCWYAFRAAQKDLLSGQALDGSVVVLVNRLGKSALPLVRGQ